MINCAKAPWMFHFSWQEQQIKVQLTQIIKEKKSFFSLWKDEDLEEKWEKITSDFCPWVLHGSHRSLRFTYRTNTSPLSNPMTQLKNPVTHSNMSVFHMYYECTHAEHKRTLLLWFFVAAQVNKWKLESLCKSLWHEVMEVASNESLCFLSSICWKIIKHSTHNQWPLGSALQL